MCVLIRQELYSETLKIKSVFLIVRARYVFLAANKTTSVWFIRRSYSVANSATSGITFCVGRTKKCFPLVCQQIGSCHVAMMCVQHCSLESEADSINEKWFIRFIELHIPVPVSFFSLSNSQRATLIGCTNILMSLWGGVCNTYKWVMSFQQWRGITHLLLMFQSPIFHFISDFTFKIFPLKFELNNIWIYK